ncbi:hypothetical protein TI04_00135 [Achromatium sp. WMS2]|nr:hypothetical protein TI04_00135 [Achromatium sp. WMS2]
MFNFISKRRGRSRIRSPGRIDSNAANWLRPCYDELVWKLELIDVANVFDADALWDIRHTGGKRGCQIVELDSKRAERRLCLALQDHRNYKSTQNIFASGSYHENRCFTDIIMCISHLDWNRDLNEHDGNNIKQVISNLCWHHMQDFRGSLPPKRPPRYLIRPDTSVAPNHVVFWFGAGIYLPAMHEHPKLHITTKIDKMLQKVIWASGFCAYGVTDNNEHYDTVTSIVHEFTRSMGFYSDQYGMLLTPHNQGPIPIATWQAGTGSYLFIRRSDANELVAETGSNSGFKAWYYRKLGTAWYLGISPNPENTDQEFSIVLDYLHAAKDNTDRDKTLLGGA